jgi:hypothetical protein
MVKQKEDYSGIGTVFEKIVETGASLHIDQLP